MVRGDIKSSTYRGSVCLHVSSKPSLPQKRWPPYSSLRKARLEMKLFSGIYLRSHAGERVNILVQIPSASRPFRSEP